MQPARSQDERLLEVLLQEIFSIILMTDVIELAQASLLLTEILKWVLGFRGIVHVDERMLSSMPMCDGSKGVTKLIHHFDRLRVEPMLEPANLY